MLLYNLFQKKLIELRRYLNNALNKNRIKFLTLSVDVPIFFSFKKDEELHLCMKYKSLNVIIIKNRYSLSFITKILNRLCKIKRFIKLDLKNSFYSIKILSDHNNLKRLITKKKLNSKKVC